MEKYYQCLDCGCKFNLFGNDDDDLSDQEVCKNCNGCNLMRIDGF